GAREIQHPDVFERQRHVSALLAMLSASAHTPSIARRKRSASSGEPRQSSFVAPDSSVAVG
ncbi:MAG: hypothetical protein O2843_01020, partial [Chloroflexi bacterium]|nr:hypothetical protein [Chloroflexota bacterium]